MGCKIRESNFRCSKCWTPDFEGADSKMEGAGIYLRLFEGFDRCKVVICVL